MNKDLLQALQASSHLSPGNIAYVEELYDSYLRNPNSISDNWRNYFANLPAVNGNVDEAISEVRDYFLQLGKQQIASGGRAVSVAPSGQQNQANLQSLITAYRSHGHHHAKLDPLDLVARRDIPDLHIEHHGFSNADYSTAFTTNAFGLQNATLKQIYDALHKTYCDTFAVEYMHITDPEQTRWLQQRIESVQSHPEFSVEEKKQILNKLTQAEGLERFLGAKYVGQTRFSLEGGVTLVPMVDELISRASKHGVKELMIGMGHRGRLNVLVNNLGKPITTLIGEFEGKSIKQEYSGDVKYHLGYSSNVKTKEGSIHTVMAFNPSHLEIINPVVEGSVRSRQDTLNDKTRAQVVPVLMHGDAAFAGQGVVMETFNLSQARGFATGGTIHIVVNNQIGFTTSNPLDARSSLYCTDVAKMVQAPVFHVNGDDPEACVFAIQVALDFRMQFKKDVVIDFVCYRRYGHNEADEPSATQPIMYRKIKSHLRTREIYANRLVAEGVISDAEAKQAVNNYREQLDSGAEIIATISKDNVKDQFADWHPYIGTDWTTSADTSIKKDKLLALGNAITTLPETFTLQAQVKREYDNRRKMLAGELPINWGLAESLAYASLVNAGYPIRISGQDSGRGTFSHRHAVLHDQNDGSIYVPLKHVSKSQAHFNVIDSILSEEAVLGFEYGYATTDPSSLVIWEAQYGDFFNGAQVVVDQFIISGEQKWGRLCGLTLFLPHGYEGAGPEHSSARIERFLQACAQKNIQVCVPTSPAQIFHLLRRQMIRPYRKPLVVFTPKSLLRHRLATSNLAELTNGEFKPLISEIDKHDKTKITRVILCTGKVYYDLLQKRREQEASHIAIIRVEQLYPFPEELLASELKQYKNAKEIIWCQEEPKNQGAWYAVHHWLTACLAKGQELTYIGREHFAAPATGYSSMHIAQQAKLVEEAIQ